MKRSISLWFPCVLVFALISYLSHLPGQHIPKFPFLNFDKYIHFWEFFVLGLFLARASYGQHRVLRLKSRWILLVLGLGMFFAFVDEYHQSFIFGRDSSLLDVLFDALGLLGAVILFFVSKRLQLRKKDMLHIDVLKLHRNLFRIYLILPVLLLLLPKLYFASQPLQPSQYFHSAPFFFDILIWSLLGLFWSRFWCWEMWWAKHRVVMQAMGVVLMITVLIFDLKLQNQLWQRVWIVQSVALIFYAIYQIGFQIANKSLPTLYQDVHKGCSEKD